MSKSELAPSPQASESLSKTDPQKPVTWNEIGEGFEVLGKISLALALGLSAAGLFCRLAEQGKVRVPSLSAMMLQQGQSQGKAKQSSTHSQEV